MHMTAPHTHMTVQVHHAAQLTAFLVVIQRRPGADRHHVMQRCIQAATNQS